MIALSHPLVKLSDKMPWDAITERVAKVLPPTPTGAGRASLPVRLMVGLLYLKHAYNVSDEQLVVRWLENPYWQYFCGEVYFQTELPCDPSSMTRWRKRLGEEGVEELLAQTIEAAKAMRAIRKQDLQLVAIDTTVQEKNVAYPTDSRLLEVARTQLVDAAVREGISLRQSYARVGPRLSFQAGRYAHAKQYKRMRQVIKKQTTILGRVMRDVSRKASAEQFQSLAPLLMRVKRLHDQKPKDKNKLYALHAPEVECISKGKARQPYEFGVKVGIAVSATRGLVLAARSFPGNPYDGDTLADQIEQAGILLDTQVKTALVDLGYRGRDVEGVTILHRGKSRSLTRVQKRLLKRRQAVEPTIGHLKDEHRMRRNFLKGAFGDALNPVLAAAGFNIRWLMRWIATFWAQVFAAIQAVLLPSVAYQVAAGR